MALNMDRKQKMKPDATPQISQLPLTYTSVFL